MSEDSNRAPIALTMGDPGGCGPLITLDAWQKCKEAGGAPFFVIIAPEILHAITDKSNVPIKTIQVPDEAEDVFEHALPVLAIECPLVKPGERDPNCASAIIKSIELAVEYVCKGQASAIVTNPINKALLQQTGFDHPGHTEFLASLAARHCNLDVEPKPVMMLTGGGLRVALVTIHIALKDVAAHLSAQAIEETARIVSSALKNDFGLSNPRIALAGLNPHAGEEGRMGREEIDIINPTARRLRDQDLNVSDAQPGDTVFAAMLDGAFDAVIAMYHDQGLAPLKTLDMWGGVNTTLGLPFVRTSPDHGTAYEAARAGAVRSDSLIAAIKLAADMSQKRARNPMALA